MALTAGTGTLTGTGYGDLSTYDAFTIQKRMLPIAKRRLTFDRFGQTETKSQKEGTEVRWRRYEKLSQATSPISEGVTPSFDQIQVSTLLATLAQYGSWVPTTDVQAAVATDPVIQQVTDRQSLQAGETLDSLTYNVVKAGTNVAYARSTGSTGRSDVNRTIGMTKGSTATTPGTTTSQLIDTAIRNLLQNDTKMITSMVGATSNVSTTPVHPAFVAVCHPDLKPDLEDLPDWIPVEQYSAQKGILDGEVGASGWVRFVLSTNAVAFADSGAAVTTDKLQSTTAVTNDVYPDIIFGMDAYGVVQLSGFDSLVSMVVMPKASSDDPLGQRGSIGWKTWHASKILQDNFMYRIECGASSLA